MDDVHGITSGSQLLSPTGRIWTVRSITPSGARVALTSEQPDGQRGAVMDLGAILRMLRIDHPAQVATADRAEAGAHPDLVRA